MSDENQLIGRLFFNVTLWHDEHTRVILLEPFDIQLDTVTFHLEPAEKEMTSGYFSFPFFDSDIHAASKKSDIIKKEEFHELERILFLNGFFLEVISWGNVQLFDQKLESSKVLARLGFSSNLRNMPVEFSDNDSAVVKQFHSKLQKSKNKKIVRRILSLLVASRTSDSAGFLNVWTAFNCVYRFHQKTQTREEKPGETARCSKAPESERKAICMFAEVFSYCKERGNILEKHSSIVGSLLCGSGSDRQKQDNAQIHKSTADDPDVWRQIFLSIYCMRNRLVHEGVSDENLDGASKFLQDVIRAYLKNLVCNDSQENLSV